MPGQMLGSGRVFYFNNGLIVSATSDWKIGFNVTNRVQKLSVLRVTITDKFSFYRRNNECFS